MYPKSNPIVPAELQPINVAIRREKTRLWDAEDALGAQQNDAYLEYLYAEKARGVQFIVINF